ncbi:MAG TPA: imelysin family protein [Ilumatobacteraceae bacterium]|nr:imelysin family protein [Ilumatobacteraceae bacterium]
MRRLVAALVVAMSFAACSGDGSTDTTPAAGDSTVTADGDLPSRDDVVAAITAEVIVPGYDRLATTTETLQTAIEDVCAQPSDARLTVAQEAWRDARQAWSATRAYRFGPATDDRTMSKIDFPIDPQKITDLLAGTEPVDVETVGALGSDQRGLGGVEAALFGNDPTDDRSCEYAASASELVATTAVELSDEWEVGSDLPTQDVIELVVNGIVFALGDVADMRLGLASGATTGIPAPAEADGGSAHSARDDMLAVLDGVDALVDHLDPLVSSQSAQTAERLATQLANARTNIELIPSPLATATDIDAIASAYRSTTAALLIARAEVASLLGVTLTLGDADGDS